MHTANKVHSLLAHKSSPFEMLRAFGSFFFPPSVDKSLYWKSSCFHTEIFSETKRDSKETKTPTIWRLNLLEKTPLKGSFLPHRKGPCAAELQGAAPAQGAKPRSLVPQTESCPTTESGGSWRRQFPQSECKRPAQHFFLLLLPFSFLEGIAFFHWANFCGSWIWHQELQFVRWNHELLFPNLQVWAPGSEPLDRVKSLCRF